jgi:hypothetical protein
MCAWHQGRMDDWLSVINFNFNTPRGLARQQVRVVLARKRGVDCPDRTGQNEDGLVALSKTALLEVPTGLESH